PWRGAAARHGEGGAYGPGTRLRDLPLCPRALGRPSGPLVPAVAGRSDEMSLWDFFLNLFRENAEERLQILLGPDRCSQPEDPRKRWADTEVKKGEHYVRIRLAQMFLKNRKAFFDTYQPAAHSLVRL